MTLDDLITHLTNFRNKDPEKNGSLEVTLLDDGMKAEHYDISSIIVTKLCTTRMYGPCVTEAICRDVLSLVFDKYKPKE